MYHDVTAQLGGPIVKDKLWFFGSYQYQKDGYVPVQTDPEFSGRPQQSSRYLFKLSWQASPRHKLEGTFHLDDRESSYAAPANSAPTTATTHNEKTPTPGLSYTGILSPKTTLNVRYGGFYGKKSTYPADPNQPPGLTHFSDLDTGFQSGGAYFFYALDVNRTTVSAKVSHFAEEFMGGSHDFRFGVQYTAANAGGLYGYNDLVFTTTNAYGTYGYGYDRRPFSYSGNTRGLSVYADDTFRLGDRLTIDAGIRYDRSRAYSGAQEQLDDNGVRTGVVFPQTDYYTWKNVSPRIGFNLKLTKDGRTALKGHWGRYHRGISTAEYANVLGPSIAPTFFGNYDLASNTFFDLVQISSTDNLSIDPNYRSPYTDQLIVSLERELASNLGVSLTYVNKKGRDLQAWRDHGGIYAPITYLDDQGVDASGGTIELLQLQNSLDELSYEITNRPEMSTHIHAATLGVIRRMTGRLQLNASISLMRANGRIAQSKNGSYTFQASSLQFNPFGRDPNDFLNTNGRLPTDVPWMVKAQALYKLPKDFLLGLNYVYKDGANRTRQLRLGDLTNLPATEILAQERGTYGRLPSQQAVDVRVSKEWKVGGRGTRLLLSADVFNVLNTDTYEFVFSDLATSSDFQKPYGALLPRRVMLGAKLSF